MLDWSRFVRRNLRVVAVRPEREAEIVEDLARQLDDAYREALASGATEAEARKRAEQHIPDWGALSLELSATRREKLTRVEQIQQNSEDRVIENRGRLTMLSDLRRDIFHGLRTLWKNPGFTAITVLTLALGIGANSAIFTAVDSLALRPLPYPHPEQLLAVGAHEAHQSELQLWTSAPDLFDLRDRAQSFSALAGISPVWNEVIITGSDAERLESLYISAEFFPMLGAQPVLGRTFRPEEDNRTTGANVVVLSYGYWQRHFGGDANVIGRSLNVSGVDASIIGVMPRNFLYLGEPLAGTSSQIDLWIPLAANPLTKAGRPVRFLKVLGRLKPGVSIEQAREEIHHFGNIFAKAFPESDAGLGYDVEMLSAQTSGRLRPMMLLLLGTVGFVLLMACANVANLLLTMTASRNKELAVRAALGASRRRLVRQIMTETALLAGLGGVIGVCIASTALRILLVLAPPSLLQGRVISLDLRALLFTAGAVTLSAVLAGFPSSLRILRADLGGGLRESGRGFTAGHYRFRAGLVVTQVSLALMLLVGAGLLIRSFVKLLDINPGFDSRHVATLSTQLPATITKVPEAIAMDRAILDRLRQVPGVQEVGAISRLPLLGANLSSTLWIEGKSYTPADQPSVEYRVASPRYFHAMGIPLIAGRFFDDHDDANAGGVVLINEAAANQYWLGQNPVGQRIKLGPNPEKRDWMTVLGVVGSVHHFGLDSRPRPEAYRPLGYSGLFSPILVARSEIRPAALLPSLAGAVHSVNSSMPIYNSFSMEALIGRSVAQRRFLMTLLACFSGAALLLAAIGIYGTISQTVTQRTKELGLRIALGAQPKDILRMVLGQGLRLTTLGIVIGALGAISLTRLIHSLLFEVSPLDVYVFAAAAVTLSTAALAACFYPALRATQVDPLKSLRHE